MRYSYDSRYKIFSIYIKLNKNARAEASTSVSFIARSQFIKNQVLFLESMIRGQNSSRDLNQSAQISNVSEKSVPCFFKFKETWLWNLQTIFWARVDNKNFNVNKHFHLRAKKIFKAFRICHFHCSF